MFTKKQHEKDIQEFLGTFEVITGKNEDELLKLMQHKKVWERYGSNPLFIYNRRRPGKSVDMKRLLKLQAKGWLFTKKEG